MGRSGPRAELLKLGRAGPAGGRPASRRWVPVVVAKRLTRRRFPGEGREDA